MSTQPCKITSSPAFSKDSRISVLSFILCILVPFGYSFLTYIPKSPRTHIVTCAYEGSHYKCGATSVSTLFLLLRAYPASSTILLVRSSSRSVYFTYVLICCLQTQTLLKSRCIIYPGRFIRQTRKLTANLLEV